jgi:uncharacterized protein (TIGR02001 family)
MIRSHFIASAALAAAVIAAGTASAAEPQVSVTLGVATDYVFRGVSQTDEGPFVFGVVALSSGDFYAGAGAETVDFGNSIDAEYDVWEIGRAHV